jgi:hypothetical protein
VQAATISTVKSKTNTMKYFADLSDRASEKLSGGQAYSANNGNASNAPGQVTATDNADALLDKQQAKFGYLENNGAKAGNTAPFNSNHFFQEEGIIG